MMVVGILVAVILALFVAAFVSKRRFGVLGLGLTAGATISPIWGVNAGFVVSSTGLIQEGPFVNAIAFSALILIPAVLFMFRGYTYKHLFGRVLGSLLFTLLAAAFLVGPIGATLTLTGPISGVYRWLVSNRELILGIGVAFVVVDFLFAKTAHKPEKRHR
jgi:hypothetical protein